MNVVSLGGDADTTGMLVGCLIGALHGTHFIPRRWFFQLENGEKGRDFCVERARRLAEMDLRQVEGAESLLCDKIGQMMEIMDAEKEEEKKYSLQVFLRLFDALKEDEGLRFDIATSISAHFLPKAKKMRNFLEKKECFISPQEWSDIWAFLMEKKEPSTPLVQEMASFFEEQN